MAVPSSSREKLGMRGSTAISGFSVRQSEEAIKNLQKENFNLKLKLFMLESRKGSLSSTPEADELCDGDYIELFLANEAMKTELDDKQALLKSSLLVIQSLEEQKLQVERKCHELIKEQHLKAVQDLSTQQKPKKLRQKKSQVNFTSTADLRHEQDAKKLRVENSELSKQVANLDKEVAKRTKCIEELSEQKAELLLRLRAMETKLSDYEDKITNLHRSLKDQKALNATELAAENKKLRQTIDDLTTKCEKLEDSGKDMERLLREQSGLMKALNRTIEAKNDELDECRSRYESIDLCSSTSDIYIPDEIDLAFASTIKPAGNSSEYPFYNPLFGHYENSYR